MREPIATASTQSMGELYRVLEVARIGGDLNISHGLCDQILYRQNFKSAGNVRVPGVRRAEAARVGQNHGDDDDEGHPPRAVHMIPATERADQVHDHSAI